MYLLIVMNQNCFKIVLKTIRSHELLLFNFNNTFDKKILTLYHNLL